MPAPGRRGARPSRLAAALVALTLALPWVPAFAQSQPLGAYDELELGLGDAAYLGVAGPIGLALMLAPARSNDLFGPTDLDFAVAPALAWEDTTLALKTADWLLIGFGAAVVTLPFVANWDAGERELAGALIGVEALASATLLSGVLKALTGRRRPTGGTYDSFFSGHTAYTFAGATMLTTFAYEYDWLEDDTRWVVPAVGYSLAAFTGYLRIAGERHWLTDVLVGAVVGTSVSYLTFALRTGG